MATIYRIAKLLTDKIELLAMALNDSAEEFMVG